MLVRKLRLRRGWSQDHLATLTGLSVRTIQRVEQGQKPSLESANALAAVFEVDVSTFITEEGPMPDTETIHQDEIDALRYAKRVKDFYEGIATYLFIVAVFVVMLLIKAPEAFAKPMLYLVLGSRHLE